MRNQIKKSKLIDWLWSNQMIRFIALEFWHLKKRNSFRKKNEEKVAETMIMMMVLEEIKLTFISSLKKKERKALKVEKSWWRWRWYNADVWMNVFISWMNETVNIYPCLLSSWWWWWFVLTNLKLDVENQLLFITSRTKWERYKPNQINQTINQSFESKKEFRLSK